MNSLLEVKNITVKYGGISAVDNLSFRVKKGEAYGLIGPNGAGKTTIFNAITSFNHVTSGNILFKGKSIIKTKPNKIVKFGISRTFQNIRLFSSLSVLDNILIGFHNKIQYNFMEAVFRLPRFFSQEKKFKKRAIDILEHLGIAEHLNKKATSLSYGNQKKVELARAIASNPDLVLLDEPVAGMNSVETNALSNAILKLKEYFGFTILLIDHDMSFIKGLCEKVLVLNYGKKIFEGVVENAMRDKSVLESYLGDSQFAKS